MSTCPAIGMIYRLSNDFGYVPYSSGAPEITPSFWWGSCCLFFSFLCFLCCIMCTIDCLFVLFIFSHSVVSLFSIYLSSLTVPLIFFVSLLSSWPKLTHSNLNFISLISLTRLVHFCSESKTYLFLVICHGFNVWLIACIEICTLTSRCNFYSLNAFVLTFC